MQQALRRGRVCALGLALEVLLRGHPPFTRGGAVLPEIAREEVVDVGVVAIRLDRLLVCLARAIAIALLLVGSTQLGVRGGDARRLAHELLCRATDALHRAAVILLLAIDGAGRETSLGSARLSVAHRESKLLQRAVQLSLALVRLAQHQQQLRALPHRPDGGGERLLRLLFAAL